MADVDAHLPALITLVVTVLRKEHTCPFSKCPEFDPCHFEVNLPLRQDKCDTGGFTYKNFFHQQTKRPLKNSLPFRWLLMAGFTVHAEHDYDKGTSKLTSISSFFVPKLHRLDSCAS